MPRGHNYRLPSTLYWGDGSRYIISSQYDDQKESKCGQIVGVSDRENDCKIALQSDDDDVQISTVGKHILQEITGKTEIGEICTAIQGTDVTDALENDVTQNTIV